MTYQLLKAALACMVCVLLAALFAGCKPDPSIEALRQENAALRRQADHDAGLRPYMDQSSIASPIGSARYPGASAPNAAPPGSAATGAANQQRTISPDSHADPISEQDEQTALGLGLPVYPKAVLYHAPTGPDNSVLTGSGVNVVVLESHDEFASIVAFYTDKMTMTDHTTGVRKQPMRADRVQEKLRIVTLTDLQPGNGMRTVVVHEDIGRVYIELMNITGKKDIPASVLHTGAAGTAPASGSVPTTGSASDPLSPPPLLPRGH